MDDKVFRLVVEFAGEVRLQDGLGAVGIADLCVDGGTRHVGCRGVSTAPWVLGIAERVILGCGLGEPDVTTVSTEVARLERLSDIFLHDDGATGGVDEP